MAPLIPPALAILWFRWDISHTIARECIVFKKKIYGSTHWHPTTETTTRRNTTINNSLTRTYVQQKQRSWRTLTTKTSGQHSTCKLTTTQIQCVTQCSICHLRSGGGGQRNRNFRLARKKVKWMCWQFVKKGQPPTALANRTLTLRET